MEPPSGMLEASAAASSPRCGEGATHDASRASLMHLEPIVVFLIVTTLATVAGPVAWALSTEGKAAGRGRVRIAVMRLLATPALVTLPLLAWWNSFSLEPPWPASEVAGWTSCLTTTSYVWLPVILGSAAAMYAVVALGVTRPAWVRAGLLMGCLAALFLTNAGRIYAACERASGLERTIGTVFWPGVTFSAYLVALGLTSRHACMTPRSAVTVSVVGLAAAAANIGAAMARMGRLPYQTPTHCYVVTAATKGHARLVRPLHEETRGATVIRVNRQLITLRAFEALWRRASPRTHGLARAVYDRVGPRIAARIGNAWVADAAYVSLKPLEWIAAAVLRAVS